MEIDTHVDGTGPRTFQPLPVLPCFRSPLCPSQLAPSPPLPPPVNLPADFIATAGESYLASSRLRVSGVALGPAPSAQCSVCELCQRVAGAAWVLFSCPG